MNGILLIDKPAGITSHTVISKLRKKLGMKKIGHAGTLDPSATGLLVMCIGKATKISSFLIMDDKTYLTDVIFGKTTNTYDSEGEIVSEKNTDHLTKDEVEKAVMEFSGDIQQKPPIYSAIKIKGKKLYQYARAEEHVEIPTRDVKIHSIQLKSFENPKAVIEASCSKGTYIRSLVHDIGEKLGVGAYVEVIRRTQSGPYTIEQSVTLDDVLGMELTDIESKLITIAEATSDSFHTINVSQQAAERIARGVEYPKVLLEKKNFSTDDMFLFVNHETHAEIAIGKWGEKDKISIKRVF